MSECKYRASGGECSRERMFPYKEFCADGPCQYFAPIINAERFKSMSIDELENTLLLEICELTGRSEYEEGGIDKSAPLDCPHDCQICLHNWLRQEAGP